MDKEKNKIASLPVFYNVMCASTAASIAETVTINVDTVKVRLMLQGEQKKQYLLEGKQFVAKYNSMLHCYYIMIKEEGFSSLFKGLSAGIQRQIIFAGLRMGTYPYVRDLITSEKDPLKIPLHHRIFAALITGAGAIIVASPTDVVKIRLQADGKKSKENRRYSGSIDAYRKIIKVEGVRGLYQGLLINVLRNCSMNAAELGTYDQVKSTLIKNYCIDPYSKLLHLACGSIAGFVAVSCLSCLDVVKTRLMNDSNKVYQGIIHCFKSSYKIEGFKVFYSGYVPNLVRVMSWNSCCFVALEKCQELVRNKLI